MAERAVPVDAHVHLYGETPERALAHAVPRFRAAVPAVETGAVLLADRAGQDNFGRLSRILPATADGIGLWLERDGFRLLVVAGRQMVAREGIEVLSFGNREAPPDGLPAQDLIATLRQQGLLVVVPFGIGKWMGSRGALVGRILAGADGVLAGDIAGRPSLWRVPQFAGRGAPLLGSDPLPLPGGDAAIGTFGNLVRANLSSEAPARDLIAAIASGKAIVGAFGRRMGFVETVATQVKLRRAPRWRPEVA